jgi:hypothetical protein
VSARRTLQLGLSALLLCGAAPPKWTGEHLYSIGVFKPADVLALTDARLEEHVQGYLRTWGITELERIVDGDQRQPVWSSEGEKPTALSRPERIALLLDLRAGLMGGETDILVETRGGRVPVSIYWDHERRVSIKPGRAFAPPAWTATAAQVQQRHGVAQPVDGDAQWNGRTLAILDRTLALLTPEEHALVKDLKFIRKREGGTHRAQYGRSGKEGGALYLYDTAFTNEDQAFVGDPSAPLPDSFYVVLHELGHAIADARVRALAVARAAGYDAYSAASDQANAMVAEFNARRKTGSPEELSSISAKIDQLHAAAEAKRQQWKGMTALLDRVDVDRENIGQRVERAFAKVLAPANAPTKYGRKNAVEAFAESYALFKTDPAALGRVSPEALAWFKAGEHLRLASQPLE